MIIRACKKLAVYAGFFFSILALMSEQVFASENDKADIACPSMDFHPFLEVFVNDEAVQRKFTKRPLKKMQFDFKRRSNTKIVTLLSKEKEIQFPVIPLKKEREEKDLRIVRFSDYDPDEVFLRSLPQPRYDTSHHEVAAIRSDRWQIFYNFEKTDACWNLVSIDDNTLISKDGDIVPNWLEWTYFQRPASCLPLTFYYDADRKQSNTGILEKLGYAPYKTDQEYAYYTIHENFYGLEATELIIPSYGFSHSIVVASDAHTLADAIFKRTGIKSRIFTPEIPVQVEDEVAYLFSKDNNQSFLICNFDH
jgi:hypothetical protein